MNLKKIVCLEMSEAMSVQSSSLASLYEVVKKTIS